MNELTTAHSQTAPAAQRRSVLIDMATRFGMEPEAFERTIRATVMPAGQEVSREQFAAFLLVAKEYGLNPLTKEIYAFPGKGGSVQPIVSIDGWMRMINNHPQFDGMEFVDQMDEQGRLVSITCKMFRKDRSHPTTVTEYMAECRRDTDTWRKWPARMLRHKAAIQAARYAFGFSGIYDEDEAARMMEAQRQPQPAQVVVDAAPAPAGRPSRLAGIVNKHKAEAVTVPVAAQGLPADQAPADDGAPWDAPQQPLEAAD